MSAPIDRGLLARGLDAARLMKIVYDATSEAGITHPEVLAAGGVVVEHSHIGAGIEAYLVRWEGKRWLVIPGTDSWGDWIRNVSSVVPWPWAQQALASASLTGTDTPAQGRSGSIWAYGFLRGAQNVCEWLKDKPVPEMSVGHSMGAALLSITAWSRDVGEAHAIASPAVKYLSPDPVKDLHVWLNSRDPVCYVPHFAHHVGTVHWLPDLIGVTHESHRVAWYIDRFERALAAPAGEAA